MSDRNDTDRMLHRFFTDDHGERLLTGDVGTGDGDVVSLAGLFAVLRAPAEPAELAGTDDVVARLAATVRDARGESVRKPVRARAFTVKVAVVATVAVLSAGAAAAATGHLPDGLQRTVSHTLSHIGVDVPAPQHGTDTPTDPTTTTAATAAGVSGTPTTAAHDAVGADATGAAKTGLCRAYVANDGHGHSRDAVAFQNLTDAATNAGLTVA